MSAAMPVFNMPSTNNPLTFFPQLKKPPKPISVSSFPTSKSVEASRNFVCPSPKISLPFSSVKKRGYTMTSKTRVFNGTSSSSSNSRSGDDFVIALEQQAFVGDGSSEFAQNMAASRLESVLNHLSKWLLAAFYVTLILWRHDAESLWLTMGSVVNTGLSIILKHILNQERPVSTMRSESVSDPGMPSSHAQSIFFAVTLAILSMVEWLGVNGVTITLTAIILALGSYLAWLRVSQQYHTISQVLVGAIVGSIFSVLWFWLWDAIVLKAFISYFWVRIVIILVAVGFCLGFIVYIIRYWVLDEN